MNQNKSIKYTYNPNPTLKYLPQQDCDSPKILQNSLLYLLYEGKYLHY